MSKQGKKKPIISTRLITGMIAVVGVVALTVATGLVFVQPQLSVMIYALSGMALFIGNHIHEQKKWGTRTEERIGSIQKKHVSLAQQVARNQERIASLKVDIAKIVTPIPENSPMKMAVIKEDLIQKMRDKVSQDPVVVKPVLVPKPSKSKAAPAPVLQSQKAAKPVRKKAASPRTPPVKAVANDRKNARSFYDTLSDIVIKELLQDAVQTSLEEFQSPTSSQVNVPSPKM